MLHLLFGGLALADHSLLDLKCGVFKYGQIVHDQSGNSGTACLTEHQSRGRIDVDEDLLDGRLMRLIVADDFVDMADNHGDAFGKRRAGRVLIQPEAT